MTPLVLTEEQMQDKFLCKAEAARWIGVTHETINNWQKAGIIKVTDDNRVPLTEVVRMMKVMEMRRAA